MQPSFLQKYLRAFHSIKGWFQYDAALLFMAYANLIRERGIAGDVLEIGVHHGLSAIAVAALRGPGCRFCAIDIFEFQQDKNISRSGGGERGIFDRNIRTFYPDTRFISVFTCASNELNSETLGTKFSFCHIDGGHSRGETFDDLRLCHSILLPGGLLALDDYFNPEFPGVCEGAVQFMITNQKALRPVAIGYNKVVFQKLPAPSDLNVDFRRTWPSVPHKRVTLWDSPVLLFADPMRSYIDLHASTPERLVPMGTVHRASIVAGKNVLRASPGQIAPLSVTITNTAMDSLPAGRNVCGVSYHLLSLSGEVIQHDNDRSWLLTPIQPGESTTLELPIRTPTQPGEYQLEIDLVWEGVMWFKDVGNPTAIVKLVVR